MIRFTCGGDGEVHDMIGDTNWGPPKVDDVQNLEDTTVKKSGGSYQFVTYRKLSTGDAAQDKDFGTCAEVKGKTFDFKWAAEDRKSAMDGKHGLDGKFSVTLDADCSETVKETQAEKDRKAQEE